MSSFSFAVGDRVSADYTGKGQQRWNATIVKRAHSHQNKDGYCNRYGLQYDDGDEEDFVLSQELEAVPSEPVPSAELPALEAPPPNTESTTDHDDEDEEEETDEEDAQSVSTLIDSDVSDAEDGEESTSNNPPATKQAATPQDNQLPQFRLEVDDSSSGSSDRSQHSCRARRS